MEKYKVLCIVDKDNEIENYDQVITAAKAEIEKEIKNSSINGNISAEFVYHNDFHIETFCRNILQNKKYLAVLLPETVHCGYLARFILELAFKIPLFSYNNTIVRNVFDGFRDTYKRDAK